MAVNIKRSIDLSCLTTLQKELTDKEFKKAMRSSLRQTATVINKEARKLVTDRYSMTGSYYTKHVKREAKVKASGALAVRFHGHRMHLTDFMEDRGPPVLVNVMQRTKAIPRTFYRDMATTEGKAYGVIFSADNSRKTKSGKSSLTGHSATSIPNIIRYEAGEVRPALEQLASEELEKKTIEVVRKALDKAAKK